MTRNVTPEMLPRAMRWMFPIFKLMTRPDNDKSAAKASQENISTRNAKKLQCLSSFSIQKYVKICGKEFIKLQVCLQNRGRNTVYARSIPTSTNGLGGFASLLPHKKNK